MSEESGEWFIWPEETKQKIERIFGGEYPTRAIEELASIIIERNMAPEPDKVTQFIESGEEPMTPNLNPYLDGDEPPLRISGAAHYRLRHHPRDRSGVG